ncbi:MAG TPA: hypothetical protein VF553_20475 [Pyrinomonadaceae bacterium]|jgi:hypothetical protein
MDTNLRQSNQALHREIAALPPSSRPITDAAAPYAGFDHAGATSLQEQLSTLLEEIDDEMLRALMLRVFGDLVRTLDYLRMSETALGRQGTPLENLAFFTLVHEEARALQIFIENRVLEAECVGEHLRHALDGISFAVRHELRRVYEQELDGLASTESDRIIRGKITHARGLLSNCFQQSLIILAQAFDQSVTGSQLFNDLPTRVEQSLVLRRDLWTLVQLARRAEAGGDLESIIAFIQYLETFRHGSMHFLMYRDWQVYERFVDEVMASNCVAELKPVIDRFACYLETLFAQVRMRAVLVNYPFDDSETVL